jgi:amphi-Trp domain-containing protein
VSTFNDRQGRGLSRQEAAERLIDVAYALAGGGKLSLDDDQELDLPVAGRVTLERQSTSGGGHTELAITLTWSEGP